MDYIHSLMIAEDDLDEETNDIVERFDDGAELPPEIPSENGESSNKGNVPPWCIWYNCRPMPLEIEIKCCKQKKCVTTSARFTKDCLDPDVLELCTRNMNDIRIDPEDISTRAFRKAAYRQFVLARYGYLGKGNRRVCPSSVVFKIRQRYPSLTGVYMGYREH